MIKRFKKSYRKYLKSKKNIILTNKTTYMMLTIKFAIIPPPIPFNLSNL